MPMNPYNQSQNTIKTRLHTHTYTRCSHRAHPTVQHLDRRRLVGKHFGAPAKRPAVQIDEYIDTFAANVVGYHIKRHASARIDPVLATGTNALLDSIVRRHSRAHAKHFETTAIVLRKHALYKATERVCVKVGRHVRHTHAPSGGQCGTRRGGRQPRRNHLARRVLFRCFAL